MSIKLQVRAFIIIMRLLGTVILLLLDRTRVDEDKVRNLAQATDEWIVEAEAYARAVVE